MIKAITHFERKGLSLLHFQTLLAVQSAMLRANRRDFPKVGEIAALVGLPVGGITKQLDDLVALRYVHSIVPTYGPLVLRYKLGAIGGTLMRKMHQPL